MNQLCFAKVPKKVMPHRASLEHSNASLLLTGSKVAAVKDYHVFTVISTSFYLFLVIEALMLCRLPNYCHAAAAVALDDCVHCAQLMTMAPMFAIVEVSASLYPLPKLI